MIVCNCAKPILVLVRKNDVVEYRVTGISTSDAQLGLINYKGNWKTESKNKQKLIGLKCNGCEEWILKEKDLKKLTKHKGEYININSKLSKGRQIDKISETKGITISTRAGEKFFGVE